MMRPSALSLVASLCASASLLGFAALASGCPQTECECFVCLQGQAVTLSVTDEDGTPLTEWLVDASVDGAPLEDLTGCAPENRVANTCGLGSEVGVYTILVRAPGFKDKEVATRVAIPAGRNCCSDPCVPNALVTVALIPEDA